MEINVCTPLKEYCLEIDNNELRVVEDLIWSNHHSQISIGVEILCQKLPFMFHQRYHDKIIVELLQY
jgi:hypothetical protein